MYKMAHTDFIHNWLQSITIWVTYRQLIHANSIKNILVE